MSKWTGKCEVRGVLFSSMYIEVRDEMYEDSTMVPLTEGLMNQIAFRAQELEAEVRKLKLENAMLAAASESKKPRDVGRRCTDNTSEQYYRRLVLQVINEQKEPGGTLSLVGSCERLGGTLRPSLEDAEIHSVRHCRAPSQGGYQPLDPGYLKPIRKIPPQGR